MYIGRSKSKGFFENNEKIIKTTLSVFKDYNEEVKSCYPWEFSVIDGSGDIMREVCRHSICVALGIGSVLSYADLDELCNFYVSKLRKAYRFSRLSISNNISYRQQLLQACMHFIIRLTPSGKGMEVVSVGTEVS